MGQVGRSLSSSVPVLSGSRHSTSESVCAKLTAVCLAGPILLAVVLLPHHLRKVKKASLDELRCFTLAA